MQHYTFQATTPTGATSTSLASAETDVEAIDQAYTEIPAMTPGSRLIVRHSGSPAAIAEWRITDHGEAIRLL